MLFETIEIPIFLPLIGSIFIIIFIFLLFKINSKIDKISKLPNRPVSKEETNEDKVLNKEVGAAGQSIKSPMVGIIYFTPDPEKPPYVKIGDHVKQGETVAIIEAMKTFNEIKSPVSGIIKEILHSSGSPVEFGEDIIRIK